MFIEMEEGNPPPLSSRILILVPSLHGEGPGVGQLKCRNSECRMQEGIMNIEQRMAN
jgi:hypothetical protein